MDAALLHPEIDVVISYDPTEAFVDTDGLKGRRRLRHLDHSLE